MEILKTIHSSSENSALTNVAIIITAAGSSTRMGGNLKKEFLPFNGGTVLSSSIKSFYNSSIGNFNITDFIVTVPENNISEAKNAIFSDKFLTSNENFINKIQFVVGGTSRQNSVFNGLQFIKDQSINANKKLVLIHDGARPFVTEEIILSVIEAAKTFGASVPGITPTDTQKEINEEGFIIRHLVRKNLTAVQTPQGFDFKRLYDAHEKCQKINQQTGKEFTDDTEIWGEFYGSVKVVPGNINNIKITYPSDLEKLK